MDTKINEMWNLAFKYKYCIVTWVNNVKQCITLEELKFILKLYEEYLKTNDLKLVEDSNKNIHAYIDDRLPTFLQTYSILQIEFKNEISEGKNG